MRLLVKTQKGVRPTLTSTRCTSLGVCPPDPQPQQPSTIASPSRAARGTLGCRPDGERAVGQPMQRGSTPISARCDRRGGSRHPAPTLGFNYISMVAWAVCGLAYTDTIPLRIACRFRPMTTVLFAIIAIVHVVPLRIFADRTVTRPEATRSMGRLLRGDRPHALPFVTPRDRRPRDRDADPPGRRPSWTGSMSTGGFASSDWYSPAAR